MHRVRQKQIPESGCFGLGLELLEQRRRLPTMAGPELFLVEQLTRINVLVHEGQQPLAKLVSAGRRLWKHGLRSYALFFIELSKRLSLRREFGQQRGRAPP